MSILDFCFLFLIIRLSAGACVSSSLMAAMGFSLNTTSQGPSVSFCANLHANGGNCVAQQQMGLFFGNVSTIVGLRNQIGTNFANAALGFQTSLASSSDIMAIVFANSTNNFSSIGANLTARDLFNSDIFNKSMINFYATVNNLPGLWATISSTALNTLSTFSTTLTTTFTNFFGGSTSASASASTSTNSASNTATLTSMLKASLDYSALKLKIIAQNALSINNNCIQNYAKITNGIYCYLTSNSADQNSEVTSSGGRWSVNISLKTNTVGPSLAICLPIIDQFCALNYGVSISDRGYIASGVVSVTTGISKQTCLDLQTGYNCTTEACMTKLYTTLITKIYNPSIMMFLPTAAVITNMNGMVSNVTANFNTLRASFSAGASARRLQSSSGLSYTMTTSASSTGQDVVTDGANSGANYQGVQGLKVSLVLGMLVLLMAF